MTTLIIGGTGKTGLGLARLLKAANYPVLLTSRSGKAPEPFKAAAFDWLDPATFENPFKLDTNIDRAYLVCPPVYDLLSLVKPFIDLAITKGVKRFVLLSASTVKPGDMILGQVHQYLLDVGVDYTVLRPTWFMQNFATGFSLNIRENNEIVSATGNGQIPLVSTEDISQAAFDALTAEKSPNTDYLLLGPELYSYDEAAKLLSSIIGREITHKKISIEEQAQALAKRGLSPELANYLAKIQADVAEGSAAADFNDNTNRKIVGKHTLKEYLETNRALWIK
jgi:festuclavine dehydrogenase